MKIKKKPMNKRLWQITAKRIKNARRVKATVLSWGKEK